MPPDDPAILARIERLEFDARQRGRGPPRRPAPQPAARVRRRVRPAPRVRPRRRHPAHRLEGVRPHRAVSTSSSTSRRPTSSPGCSSTPASRWPTGPGPRDQVRRGLRGGGGAGLPRPPADRQRRAGDAVGRRRRPVRPAGRAGRATCARLARALRRRPAAGPADLGAALHDLAGRIGRRGVVFVFSDFLDDVPAVLAGLRHLRYLSTRWSSSTSWTRPSWTSRSATRRSSAGWKGCPRCSPTRCRARGLPAQFGKHPDALEAGCRRPGDGLRAAADRRRPGPRAGGLPAEAVELGLATLRRTLLRSVANRRASPIALGPLPHGVDGRVHERVDQGRRRGLLPRRAVEQHRPRQAVGAADEQGRRAVQQPAVEVIELFARRSRPRSSRRRNRRVRVAARPWPAAPGGRANIARRRPASGPCTPPGRSNAAAKRARSGADASQPPWASIDSRHQPP